MAHDFPRNDRVRLSLDDDGVAHVTLTRGDKLNALDPAMIDALLAAGHALFGQPALRAVVLSGEGRAFCAGLDIAAMGSSVAEGALELIDRSHGNANHFQQIAVQWRKLPVPVIAAIHGVCYGGGAQIAAGADIRIAAPDARLAIMEMRWGLIPDMGGFALLRDCVREDVLRELTYTNAELSGEEACKLGLVTHVDADPLARAMALAREIAARNPHAVRAAKRLFNQAHDLSFDAILMEESLEQHRIAGSRNQKEAVRAQMTRTKPDFSDPA